MARAMWQMCEAAQNFKSHDHIFELHEKALHMFECSAGREHCDVAQAFMIVSAEYKHQGNLIKAEELAGEAYKIFNTLLGFLHINTSRACVCLCDIQKLMGKKVHTSTAAWHVFDDEFDMDFRLVRIYPKQLPRMMLPPQCRV